MSGLQANQVLSPPITDPEKFEEIDDDKIYQEETQGPASHPSPKGWPKFGLVSLLCLAQFFDIFTACAAIAALPTIGTDLHFTPNVLPWVLTAYTLTFGAFQVPAGRLSDIHHPKPVFCAGFLGAGIFNVLCGVSTHPIMLLVFRALCGIAAAMTVPSAISILVQTFPDPKEQADVLGIFSVFGAIGNCAGIVIGGILAARLSWQWVFYLIAIVIIPMSIVSFFALPNTLISVSNTKRTLDLPGITIFTCAMIMFVYAISSGNSKGWGSPEIVTTLVFSIICFISFLFVERFVSDPALPPKTWKNKNFAVMFFYAWSIYWFFIVMESQLITIFQDIWHWSPLSASLHTLPTGIAGGLTSYVTGAYGHLIPKRILLISGQVLMIVGVALLALADDRNKYWSHIFPGMIVSTVGLGAAYVGSTATMMAGAKKGEEGMIGAVLNTSYQIGGTLGVAVATAIILSVNAEQPEGSVNQMKGYTVSFWSLVTLHGLAVVISVLFVHN